MDVDYQTDTAQVEIKIDVKKGNWATVGSVYFDGDVKVFEFDVAPDVSAPTVRHEQTFSFGSNNKAKVRVIVVEDNSQVANLEAPKKKKGSVIVVYDD